MACTYSCTITSASSASSTPPFPSRVRPTSNWGLTITSMVAVVVVTVVSGAISRGREMKETSATTRSKCPRTPPGGAMRMRAPARAALADYLAVPEEVS